jgi:hypothetical protein
LIVMVPFSLAGLAPPIYYQLAFAVVMLVLLATIYLVLLRFADHWTACAFLLWLFVGGWGTALGRFDLFPAVLTLCALLCAERARWNYAFALLALAALAKIHRSAKAVYGQMVHMAALAGTRSVSRALYRRECCVVAIERGRDAGSVELFWQQTNPGRIRCVVVALACSRVGRLSADVRL